MALVVVFALGAIAIGWKVQPLRNAIQRTVWFGSAAFALLAVIWVIVRPRTAPALSAETSVDYFIGSLINLAALVLLTWLGNKLRSTRR